MKTQQPKPTQRNYLASTWKLLAASLILGACGSRMQDVQGSESHFLAACDETCGGGLSCIDHRCTRACNDQRDCDGVSPDAVCVGSEQSGAQSGVCDRASAAPCEEGGYRYALGDTWACSDGCNWCTCYDDGLVGRTLTPCGDVQPTTCEEGGQTYQLGDEWQCSDGCNSCFCTEEGVESTLLACAVCNYEGRTYDVGDEWPCSDGCNTCTCTEDGTVSATEIFCGPITCWSNDVEYVAGDVVELGSGVTCVCQENGELGQCSGVPDAGSATNEPAVSSGPTDGGPADPDDRARCYLPPDSGDCDAAFPAIYFDAESGQCLQFIWGGCGGNENRFDTLDECYAACGQDAN